MEIGTHQLAEYLISCIDLTNYLDDDSWLDWPSNKKLAATYEIFMVEKYYEFERVGNRKAVSDWLAGLCSSVSVAFTDEDINSLVKKWSNFDNEHHQANWRKVWFDKLGLRLFSLWQRKEVLTYRNVNLIFKTEKVS